MNGTERRLRLALLVMAVWRELQELVRQLC